MTIFVYEYVCVFKLQVTHVHLCLFETNDLIILMVSSPAWEDIINPAQSLFQASQKFHSVFIRTENKV